MEELLLARLNYWTYIILMMIGLYAMIGKRNLIKKLIGMSIFQSAIILFFVSIGVKRDATIPILKHEIVHAYHEGAHTEKGSAEAKSTSSEPGPAPSEPAGRHGNGNLPAIDPQQYENPLPHVLMLTAIVVGVSTLGVALAIVQSIYRECGSLEEDIILRRMELRDD